MPKIESQRGITDYQIQWQLIISIDTIFVSVLLLFSDDVDDMIDFTHYINIEINIEMQKKEGY